MYDYSFSLTPYTGFVKGLCGVCSNDFSIIDDSDSDLGQTDIHLLSSPHLNIISDPNELASKLKGLLMLMNGALSVLYGFERYQSYGPLSISGSDGINYSEICGFKSMDVTQINPFDFHGIQKPHPRADDFSRLINLSSKHESLRVVLGMCALGNDWVNLYRLWETIREYVHDKYVKGTLNIPSANKSKKYQRDKIISMAFNIDEKEISRFTGTANSFELLGYLARHGKGSPGGIVKNPMSRVDASIFVHNATCRFCALFLM
ncbi:MULTISPECIES: hypothetical protein [Klebsiella]|jgi:hypothetical protein|uniref:Uncharacterized protein n=1 Tax=Klebsiella pasteurii TaxID=2587529 RepID=A0A9Q9UJD4_9ENTR|nr:hypothetical protein [Klebsiella pasteurii]VUS32534.1 hypothetical protein SB6410_04861 [Klebsiella pasteurii]VUS69303.1 hypothetical protein SB6409_00794 [Klebsiella pasteurii]